MVHLSPSSVLSASFVLVSVWHHRFLDRTPMLDFDGGCEGRISVSKRRHGLNRCRYRGDDGMQRWGGLGVISDNLINIGLAISKQSAK
jgi:hypothetical protein